MGAVEDLRKSQEEISRLREGGYYKELVLLHWELYSAYLEAGFNEEQALTLVVKMFGVKGEQ